MLEIVLLMIALVGSSLAALFDLKTTEIPDEIPYAMMIVGIIAHVIKSFLVLSYWPFLLSVIVGLSFLGFGFLMYYIGQWGGGDAKILSAMGFLIPVLPPQIKTSLMFPLPLSFFFNVFLVGAFYMIVYAVVLSMIERNIWLEFVKDLRANTKMIMIFNLSMVAFIVLLVSIFANYYLLPVNDMIIFIVTMLLVSVGFFILWKFVKTVEKVGFKKRILVSKLRVGDVPDFYKIWEGVTEKEIEKIKKSGKKYIWIKSGVRFAPAFPLALLFTLYFGDGISLLIGLRSTLKYLGIRH
ncbi:MAG: A24 family peptidase [Candidatus Aenigmarchaeota archaeon]|nr:A24 family peptidase [Candidatus Aenigmarchaeota archaeon]